MKPDDFEKELRQPFRQIPPEWRAEILNAVRPSVRDCPSSNLRSIWETIWIRFPLAWGSLAALWVAVLVINFIFFGGHQTSPQKFIAETKEPFTIWRLQGTEFQQLAGGKEPFDAPAEMPASIQSGPRSERRREDWMTRLDGERCFEMPV